MSFSQYKPKGDAMYRLLIVFLLLGGLLPAHENWLMPEQFSAAPGQTVTVRLCGGHYFPESSFAVKDKLVYQTVVISPAGDTTAFSTTALKKYRRGEITLPEEGLYQVLAILKRPQKKEPEYWMKTVVQAGTGNQSLAFSAGNGLEIIPGRSLGTLRVGDELPVQVLYHQAPVQGSLSISIDGRKNYTVKTGETGRTTLHIKRAGRYLLFLTRGSQGSSLTFQAGE